MRKILQCITRIITVSIVALISMQSLVQNNQAEAYNVICQSRECQERAKWYMNNIKKEVDPCHDFYEYACGNLQKAVNIPQHIEVWKIEEVFREKTNKVIQNLLEDPRKAREKDVENAKAFHKACMALPYLQRYNPFVLKTIMSKVGNWPMFLPNGAAKQSTVQWWQINNEYMKLNGESALFDIALTGDRKNNYKIVTLIMELGSPYGMLQRISLWGQRSNQRNHYLLFLQQLIKAIAPSQYNEANMAKDLTDVVNFRDELLKVHQRNILNAEGEKDMTIKKLQEIYNKIPRLSETGKINWLETIRHVYVGGKDAYGRLVQPSTTVRVNMPYLIALAGLLSSTPKAVIINHIHLYFAERQIILSPSMVKELDGTYGLVDGHLDGYKRVPMPRSEYCIMDNPQQQTITAMYTMATMSKHNMDQVRWFIHHAKQLYKKSISDSPWLDGPTKAIAMERVGNILYSIAYPEWYDTHEELVEMDPFELNPTDPEAYYVALKNKIYISAAILQSPIYAPNLPPVVNYGSLVFVIAHELQHAFDFHGESFEDNHLLTWSMQMLEKFVKRGQCIKSQYRNHRRPYLQKYDLLHKAFIPESLKEDIADGTGLKIAFKGYREKLHENKGVCETLPGFHHMDCDKLFFIAYANTMCSYMAPVGEKYTLQVDSHSLPRIRVNGVVSNMEAFSNAFGCKPTDPMNPKDKCDIWNK